MRERLSLQASAMLSVLAVVALAGCNGPETTGEPAGPPREPGPEVSVAAPPDRAAEARTATSSFGAAGQTAYVDPRTGRLVSHPPPDVEALEIPPDLAIALDSSHAHVRVKRLPNGMMIAEKPGGFRTATIATLDEDGELKLKHVSAVLEDSAVEKEDSDEE